MWSSKPIMSWNSAAVHSKHASSGPTLFKWENKFSWFLVSRDPADRPELYGESSKTESTFFAVSSIFSEEESKCSLLKSY